MTLWDHIGQHISETLGRSFTVMCRDSVAGGSINAAYQLGDGTNRYFVKLNDAARHDMFTAEAAGLADIANTKTLRVPGVVCHGTAGDRCYLVLEYLEIAGGRQIDNVRFGQALAKLHKVTQPSFGWRRDNTIGATPQINTMLPDWVSFWRDDRLAFQLDLAARNGYAGSIQDSGERLLNRLGQFFSDYRPRPSLLHGDLWSGNYGALPDGTPVIFDPAVYFGDRETDIAMTELFGGFSPQFYAAYREEFPLDTGYNTRKALYNLYHVLNHVNLFGGGYLAQAETMIGHLLSEIS